MNNVVRAPFKDVPTLDTSTLDGLITGMTRYGKPRLSYMGDGWHAVIDMYVSSAGAEFKVVSDFKMPSAMAAMRQCADRVVKTLADLK